ncbi:MAG: MFS transporter, partial [Limisphaerales bacterium]
METASTNSTAAPKAAETKRNPWLWIPSLYFAQGIPYVVVMTMSVIMYKRLGVSNTDIALYTSLLNWPWVIKPLWSPFVDILKTKRWWILSMQFLIAIGLAVAGISVQTQIFFTLSLALFWLMAFSSATHDIAADGFYMLGLSKHDQTWWVGIRSTFFRLAVIVGSGILVMFAGFMESKNGLAPVDVRVVAEANAAVPTEFDPSSITVSEQAGELRLVNYPESLSLAPVTRPSDEVTPLIAQARSWNREKGFYPEEKAAAAKKEESGESAWTRYVTKPFGNFLARTFPKQTGEKSPIAGNVGVIYFTLSKEPPADKDVVVNFTFDDGDKSIRVVEGERFVFNSQNWNQPFMAVVQLDSKLRNETSAVFQARAGNIPLAWSITLMTIGGLFLVFFVYHNFVLPKPAADVPTASSNNVVKEFFTTFGSYFS